MSYRDRPLSGASLFDWLRFAMAMPVAAAHFSLVPWPQAGNPSSWSMMTQRLPMTPDYLQ